MRNANVIVYGRNTSVRLQDRPATLASVLSLGLGLGKDSLCQSDNCISIWD